MLKIFKPIYYDTVTTVAIAGLTLEDWESVIPEPIPEKILDGRQRAQLKNTQRTQRTIKKRRARRIIAAIVAWASFLFHARLLVGLQQKAP